MNDEMIALVAPDTATTSCESERRHLLGLLREHGFVLPLAEKQFTAACGVNVGSNAVNTAIALVKAGLLTSHDSGKTWSWLSRTSRPASVIPAIAV